MRVALDQLSLSGPGSDRGLGRYAGALARAAEEIPDTLIHPVRGAARDDGLDFLQVQTALLKMDEHPDVYHSTSVHHLPLVKRTPWLCTIQDTIPLDLRAYARLGLKSRALFANARRADVILANSLFTAERVRKVLHISSQRIEICTLPVTGSYFSPGREYPSLNFNPSNEKFVVAMVDMRTPDPRKRFHWITPLAHALEKKDVKFVVVGRGTAQVDVPSSATRIEAPSDAELAALYSHSLSFFYPSAYEGQGMPPLEAMAAGAPVIAFQNSAITEMVAEQDFLVADPAPWEEHSLDAPLPTATLEVLQERIMYWANNGASLAQAREQARKSAHRFGGNEFASQLAHAYERFRPHGAPE